MKRTLKFQGRKMTVLRFSLDGDGNLIEASMNDVFKRLRSTP